MYVDNVFCFFSKCADLVLILNTIIGININVQGTNC